MDMDRRELLEIYKLHAELADRISQRREGANRLYVSLLAAISALLAASLRYGTGVFPVYGILMTGGLLGILLSASWFVVIRSYRQLNTGKFAILHELETKLSYPFFQREWAHLQKGRSLIRYWKLTVVETFVPIGFFILALIITYIAILSWYNS